MICQKPKVTRTFNLSNKSTQHRCAILFGERSNLDESCAQCRRSKKSVSLASQYFENISVDLIYGIPGLTNEEWRQNIQTVLDFNIPHISSYALTVEPKTALAALIQKGKIENVNDDLAQAQFSMLTAMLEKENFVHYELSNFGKESYFSQNNTGYWLGKTYIGIGPSAHSFDGKQRSWNVRNNAIYIKKMEQNRLPVERETLSDHRRL